ncbi:MAG: hypothetical protein HFI69_02850 [Lachnospiraceae bacterium]|jgi:hypothetical protein|nr:hypothetical protein [Lachnospiraceae bacterium]
MRKRKGRENQGERWFARWKAYLHNRKKDRCLKTAKDSDDYEEDERGNPYLPKLRSIMEQLLPMYQLSYRDFRPLLIDTDTPPESLLDEDPAAVVLEQLSEDLNFLRISSDRPAYFSDYIHRMYEESGLVVQILPKGQDMLEDINVILDLEEQGDCSRNYMREHILYIPVFKRKWNRVGSLQNLDISIPIGYNTVIVKGIS